MNATHVASGCGTDSTCAGTATARYELLTGEGALVRLEAWASLRGTYWMGERNVTPELSIHLTPLTAD